VRQRDLHLSDLFTITGEVDQYRIKILSANGTVYQTINGSGDSHSIDITQLPQGLYFVKAFHLMSSQMEKYHKRAIQKTL